MIATESKRQLAPSGMISNGLCDGFTDTGYEAGILELANGRVVLLVDLLELVVAVKVDLPAELCELLRETSFDEADGAVIDALLRLDRGEIDD